MGSGFVLLICGRMKAEVGGQTVRWPSFSPRSRLRLRAVATLDAATPPTSEGGGLLACMVGAGGGGAGDADRWRAAVLCSSSSAYTHARTHARGLWSQPVFSSLRSMARPIVALLALTVPEPHGLLQSNDNSRQPPVTVFLPPLGGTWT